MQKISEHKQVVNYFMKKYFDKYKQKYDFKGSKDGALIKRLLKLHGFKEVMWNINQLFISYDPFFKDKPRTVGMLSACWNNLTIERDQPLRTGRHEEEFYRQKKRSEGSGFIDIGSILKQAQEKSNE